MLYLSQDSHQALYTFIQMKWQCFKSFIAFYTYLLKYQLFNKLYSFLVISTHSLKIRSSLIKSVNDLAFYNYSSIL